MEMYYKYCQNCNSYNNANNSFCLNCGQDIRNNPVYQQEPQQNYQQPVQQYYYQQAYPQNYSQNQYPAKSLFTKGSIISLIAGIILIISCFLPYIGFYLVILSSICICVGGFITKIETDKKKK